MANMSYCRFENTYSDLGDCVLALEGLACGEEKISESELAYARKMRSLCDDFLSLLDEIDDMDEKDLFDDDDEDF